MKKYWALIFVFIIVVTVTAVIRLLPSDILVVERNSGVTVYDTVKIISTPDGKNFKARKIELNKADSAQLVSVYGIGAVLSQRIIEYRGRLGGFYRKEQLKEIKGITDEVYHNVEANFFVDTLGVQKINLNFATRKQLEKHPYFSKSMIDRVLKAAEMKGGYETIRQLLDDDILLPREAQRIAPYVVLGAAK